MDAIRYLKSVRKSEIALKELRAKYEKVIEKNTQRYADIRCDVLSKIYDLDDERYVQILYQKYIQNLTIESIAESMGYSVQYVWKLHTNAIRAMQDIVEKM